MIKKLKEIYKEDLGVSLDENFNRVTVSDITHMDVEETRKEQYVPIHEMEAEASSFQIEDRTIYISDNITSIVNGNQSGMACCITFIHNIYTYNFNMNGFSKNDIVSIGVALHGMFKAESNKNSVEKITPLEELKMFLVYIENAAIGAQYKCQNVIEFVLHDSILVKNEFENGFKKIHKNGTCVICKISGRFISMWSKGKKFFIFDPNGNERLKGGGAFISEISSLSELYDLLIFLYSRENLNYDNSATFLIYEILPK